MSFLNFSRLTFTPLIDTGWLAILCAITVLMLIISLRFLNIRTFFFRTASAVILFLILLNPSILFEQKTPIADTALIIVDESPSQNIGQRTARTQTALSLIKSALDQDQRVDYKIVSSSSQKVKAPTGKTVLFSLAREYFKDVPTQRRAGIILLTDGQVHDIPAISEKNFTIYGPVNALISGKRNEIDRSIKVIERPAYGIVGDHVEVTFMIEDHPLPSGETTNVIIIDGEGNEEVIFVPINQKATITLPITAPGHNVFQIIVSAIKDEITEHNNTATLAINGIRNRMKVLLVSGKPYAGTRTWRNLLKSDPAIDLVHFTILREPEKIDHTPSNEMALVAFPIDALFDSKINEFDLIIFDRYDVNRILPSQYFDNIAHYVQGGGAFFEISGPEFSSQKSIYRTNLSHIIPGTPNGRVIEKPFLPSLTQAGEDHPVTRNLSAQTTEWGPWLRQNEIVIKSGDTLLHGYGSAPLLTLARTGKGRTAQISSDHLWLWEKGYRGGGPYTKLMRRVIHWLLKEPSLDEKSVHLSLQEQTLTISSYNKDLTNRPFTLTKPDGSKHPVTLKQNQDGKLRAKYTVGQSGIYRLTDGKHIHKAITIGEALPKEQRDLRSTEAKLRPVTQKTFGNTLWLNENLTPQIRVTETPSLYSSVKNDILLRTSRSYHSENTEMRPLFPAEIYAIIMLGALLLCWWFESKQAGKCSKDNL